MTSVSWFSAGCSSFIAAYLKRAEIDHVIYIDIANQHPDSMRFVHNAEKLLRREIEIIRSDVYKSVDDVIEKRGFIRNNLYAPCTQHLKQDVRSKWEKEHADEELTYIWGYDVNEIKRAERLDRKLTYCYHEFPLIEAGLTKQDVHQMCADLGIKRPTMYDLGYPNNNCIGCIKGGMGYWNKIRVDFPDVFERRAKQERKIGHSCIKDVFLDELEPTRGNMEMEIMPDCSIMCYLATLQEECDE